MESFVRRKLGEADIVGHLSSQQSFGLQNIGCVQLATFYAILSTKILKFKLGLFSLDSQIELACTIMRWSCILRGQLILFPNLVSRSFVSYLTCSLTLSILDIQGLLLSSVELLCRWKIYTQMWSSWLPTKKAHATSWAWQCHHLSCHFQNCLALPSCLVMLN